MLSSRPCVCAALGMFMATQSWAADMGPYDAMRTKREVRAYSKSSPQNHHPSNLPGDPANPNNPYPPGDPANPNNPYPPGDPANPNNPYPPGDPANPNNPYPPGDPANPNNPYPPGDPANPNNPYPPGDPNTSGLPNPSGLPYTPNPQFPWEGPSIGAGGGGIFPKKGGGESEGGITPHFIPDPVVTDLTIYSTLRKTNTTLGPRIGYNWQNSDQYVVGLETDINYKSPSETNFSGQPPILVPADATAGQHTYYTLGIKGPKGVQWFGTLRGRLGYALDKTLFYITGGFAIGWGNTGATANYYDSYKGSTSANPATSSSITTYPFASKGRVRLGWTVGMGVERALSRHWIARLELLHVAFGNGTQTLYPQFPTFYSSLVPVNLTLKENDNFTILRGGIGYHF